MKNWISLILVLALVFVIGYVQFSDDLYKTKFGVVQSDVKGYYSYLPLFFIYDDLKIEKKQDYQYNTDSRMWYSSLPDGTKYLKYTMGMSILYAPFFLIANIIAEPLGYLPDGYSIPYQVLLMISSLFYLVLGLFFIRRLLLRYFSDWVVALTLVVIYLGTNLYYYNTQEMTFSHGYSFALVSAFIYLTVLWYKSPGLVLSILTGLVFGLLVLVRPVDFIFIIFPILYGVTRVDDIMKRLSFFRHHFLYILIFIVCFLLAISPQFLYWKHVTGNFFFFSYGGESFHFSSPRILQTLFSYRNGWLIYSPLMIMGLIGTIMLYRRLPVFFWTVVSIVVIYTYVVSSWWCWWYSGFGNRAFINMYPFLAFGIAQVFQFILDPVNKYRKLVLPLIALLVYFNLFQTKQRKHFVIHWSDMTPEAYWKGFGKKKRPELLKTYLRKIDVDSAIANRYLIRVPVYEYLIDKKYDFNNGDLEYIQMVNPVILDSSRAFSGARSGRINEGKKYGFRVRFPVMDADEVYIRLRIKNEFNGSLVLRGSESFKYYRESTEVVQTDSGWDMYHIFASFERRKKPDTLFFNILNKDQKQIWLDDFHLQTRKVSYVHERDRFW